MRFAPVMLALLLALSPAAVALQAAAPPAPAPSQTDGTALSASDGNTTTVTTLGTAPARTGFDSPSLALGSSLTMDRGEFRSNLSVKSLDQQLRAADTAEAKKQILIRYRYRIENRIISLKARERQVTDAFSNGTVTERRYLRTLGRIDTEAGDIRNMIDAMRTRAQNIPRFNLATEANTLRGKLILVEGPVRDRIGKTIRGKIDMARIYVATTDTGVVLSTVSGNTYVREVIREDRRDPSATPNLSPIEAQQAVYEHYPWARTNFEGANTLQYGSTNIISVAISHTHGDLVAYLDSGTEKIFKEVQNKRLTGEHSRPPGPAVSNTTNRSFGENVTLTVNRTYAGGPLRVKLTNSTGAPLQGEITVAGDAVGRTDPDGVLWTLGPAESFRVSAVHEGTTINVTATPTSLP